MTPLACADLVVTIGNTRLLDGVSLEVAENDWVSVVGPNGAGKSTLLRVLAGLSPAQGSVELFGRPIGDLGRRERARTVALVPQIPIIPLGMTVADYVLLGRTPYISTLGTESAADLIAVGTALAHLDLEHLADRPIETLSGGERQRAVIARSFAQEAPLLLLDEPTAALDVGHQQDVLDLVDDLRRHRGLTVVSTMHDLTLAGHYAKRLVLLSEGRVLTAGSPAEVLTEEHLTALYGARLRVIDHADGPIIVPGRHRSESL